jgi:hypothetical protein
MVEYFMKNLEYYIAINSEIADENTYLSLIQNEISGGRISQKDIDVITQYPGITEISISGLTQDTFNYFIENYGSQFKAINFWKCPLIKDLSGIELLSEVEYITYYWNQRAEELWDFSKTKSLKGFSFDDFTRMHDISQIPKSPALEELSFGNMIWRKYILNSLEPLKECSGLKTLSFSAKKVLDNRIQPVAKLKNLESLEFPANMFSTEQVAWLKAHLPPTVKSRVLHPYWQIEEALEISGKQKNTFIVGKRKPFLDSVRDKKRVEKYVEQFNAMYQWYLENPTANPEDYRAA